uniref:NADH-ubiquinone oxidoreductase chain 4L n=1 Tax=Euwallacea fornicatus TaxID=995702 RepID=A0A8A2F390_9CUCU|nr:NADH dehydrogenase subunit 4L [Euwallacea fornicatus]QSV10223.1 NADH dehydrogenase subunit 4L [Euwallacea fornicatus]UZT26969.1 NADH dehydrogenase subunit 4L [Euwallacea fornicatus]
MTMFISFGSISFTVLFISGLISYVLSNKHFLLMLISLEVMVLSMYMILFFYFIQFNFESFVNMIYLTLSVSEGALGLSILVNLIRTHGMDMVLVFDSLW